MELSDENDKREIIISKTTSDLTTFSASGLVKRGLEVAGSVIKQSRLLNVENILLSILADDISIPQDYLDQKIITDSAELLLNIRKNAIAISRLMLISQDTDWDECIRLDALEILAKFGYKDFAVDKIMGILKSAQNKIKDPNRNPKRHAIIKLEHIGEISEIDQIEILSYVLSNNKYLLFSALEIIRNNEKIGTSTYSMLVDVLQADYSIEIKLDICKLLIDLGHKKEATEYLNFFLDAQNDASIDAARNIAFARNLLREINITHEVKSKIVNKLINDPQIEISEKIEYLTDFIRASHFKNKKIAKIEIRNLDEWFTYMLDEPSILDYWNIIELSYCLFLIGYENVIPINYLFNIVQNYSLNSDMRSQAYDVLRGTELNKYDLEEIVRPCMENENEDIYVRFSAASVLSIYPNTRHLAVDFMLSQLSNLECDFFEFDRFEQICVLGYNPNIISKLTMYLSRDNLSAKMQLLACKCIIEMTRDHYANQ